MQPAAHKTSVATSPWTRSTKSKAQFLDVKWLLKDSIYVKEIATFHLVDQYHFHNNYEIALILKSKGTRIIGDNIENFTDGDLVMLGPQIPHISYVRDEQPGEILFHALVVYFHPDWFTESQLNSENLGNLRKLLNDTKRGIKISGATKDNIAEKIIHLQKCTGLESIIRLLEILETISRSNEYECLASEGYAGISSEKSLERLDNVYQYVRDHFTDEISLENIAAIANMTPTAFCKYFKSKTQKTFSNFVNEVRIGYACKLLYDEDLSVSQVCYKCGFNNLTNFNKNFKQFTKRTPSGYKASLKTK